MEVNKETNVEELEQKKVDNRQVMLINPQFQLRFIAYITSFTLIGLAIIFLSNIIFFNKLHAEGMAMGLPPDHLYFEFIQQQKWHLTFIFLVSAVCLFTLIFIAGLYLSHKLAGPVYRVGKWVDDVITGRETRKLTFREHDFFPEVADHINRLKKYLEEKK